MKQFMILLRGGEPMDSFSPAEMEAHMGRWKTWMGELAQAGKLAGGLPLNKTGKQVTKHGEVIMDGPFAEGKEMVGGYLIFNAEDIEGAIEIAKECPILEGAEGNCEVREIMSM